MSSSSAPSYYFTFIDFNSAFYNSSSSTSSSIFLKRTQADTALGLITFANGLNSATIQSTASPMNLYTTNSLANTLNLGNANMTLNLNCPIVPQALTFSSPSQIGWSQSLTNFIDTAYVGPGTYTTMTSQSITTGVQLPVGKYMFIYCGSTTISTGLSAGVTAANMSSGYYNNSTYGSTSGIQNLVNVISAQHPLCTRTAGQYHWNCSTIINNTIANGYITGFHNWLTDTAISAGSVVNRIHNFSLIRIA
jgi:hypothetical protein